MANDWMLRVWAELTAPRVRDERGDVPGWVMITLMTATLVGVIWGISQGRLTAMLGDAFDAVTP
jgi:hypothetical protein